MADQTTILLDQFKNGQISMDEVQRRLKEIEQTKLKTVTYKLSAKGGVSFYGLRRLPITLYRGELDQIIEIANSPEFKQFLVENDRGLSTKPAKTPVKEVPGPKIKVVA